MRVLEYQNFDGIVAVGHEVAHEQFEVCTGFYCDQTGEFKVHDGSVRQVETLKAAESEARRMLGIASVVLVQSRFLLDELHIHKREIELSHDEAWALVNASKLFNQKRGV